MHTTPQRTSRFLQHLLLLKFTSIKPKGDAATYILLNNISSSFLDCTAFSSLFFACEVSPFPTIASHLLTQKILTFVLGAQTAETHYALFYYLNRRYPTIIISDVSTIYYYWLTRWGLPASSILSWNSRPTSYYNNAPPLALLALYLLKEINACKHRHQPGKTEPLEPHSPYDQ